ncbi:MAG: hypothetical protein IJS78_05460 [Clostridia bacterium]|nr:hypothetical protein [Clostridia bacterium]
MPDVKFDGGFEIKKQSDMEEIVREAGILPLFTNSIRGFSVEEHVDPSVWFTDEPGPWEWKGPVIANVGCAYGKLFERKAAFVRRDIFAHLANYRRDGYDFDARFDDGLASFREKDLFETADRMAPVLSRDLKAEGGWGKGGKKGFDALLTGLQMKCYILTENFVYDRDRHGKPYGWGIGVYSTPERIFGDGFRGEMYSVPPEKSKSVLLDALRRIVPYAGEKTILKFLG